jgi:hypothetical protein
MSRRNRNTISRANFKELSTPGLITEIERLIGNSYRSPSFELAGLLLEELTDRVFHLETDLENYRDREMESDLEKAAVAREGKEVSHE